MVFRYGKNLVLEPAGMELNSVSHFLVEGPWTNIWVLFSYLKRKKKSGMTVGTSWDLSFTTTPIQNLEVFSPSFIEISLTCNACKFKVYNVLRHTYLLQDDHDNNVGLYFRPLR